MLIPVAAQILLGQHLSGLFREMATAPAPWKSLRAIQFGKGSNMDYDPICFDIKSRKKNREYRMVKIDPGVLSNNRLKLVAKLAH